MQQASQDLKPEQGFKPEDIIEIIIKRRWFIIIPFCISMIVGIVLIFTLPKIYSAQTLILIQPQKVPANYVRSVISTDVDSRLNTISQQIMSRSNLEKIIHDFNLFSGEKYAKMFMEDKIESLRKRISVNLIRNRRIADAFTISFKGKDPEKVMKITNALTSYIIDANIRVRETEAMGTSAFLKGELDSMRAQLVAQEKKLKEYREKYMGGLPEQLDSNLQILEQLRQQLNEKQASLRDAKNRLAMLQNQVSIGPGPMNQGAGVTDGGRRTPGSGESLTPERAKALLAYLETRYTDKHPDVIRLKKIIAESEQKNGKNNPDTTDSSPHMSAGSRMQTAQIKAEMNNYISDIANLKAQIDVYQKYVENTPKREQELLSLNRDYHNIKASYDSLLNRQLEAEISANMEKKQKGEQFRVVDSAKLPQKPISPNERRLFLMVIAIGLGFGGGLIFLMEYLNTSFNAPEDIESCLGLSVLATVPLIYHKKDKRRRRLNQVFSIVSIMLSFFLLAVYAALTFKGVDNTMALVSKLIAKT